MSIHMTKAMIEKFDVPGPRYTSYPTAPEWSTDVTPQIYQNKLHDFGKNDKTLSLYIHIPFCRTMCSFCACSVVIRPKDEKYGDEYLRYLFKEIDLVRKSIGRKKKVKQFHWGGGTPTFLTEKQIEKLFYKIQENFDVDLNGEVAVEIDPRTIDKGKVQKLRQLGFNRVSMGVQDFDPTVQESVNRRQPLTVVEEFNDWCRELRFHSINFDLIYGLPYQTPASVKKTIAQVVRLRPDRIAFYSFAYVPWLKAHQSKIEKEKLPTNDEKLNIFLNSRGQFLDSGYQAIAMDHFALTQDELARAFNAGKLYRNFMGYTVKPADEYIGLGMTAIGFVGHTYFQNQKTLPQYYRALDNHGFAIERGRILSEDDRLRQWVINSLMCQFHLDKNEFKKNFQKDFDEYFHDEHGNITRYITDGLLSSNAHVLEATELGKVFIRNVCMGFDWYLRQKEGHKQFSKTI